MGEGACQRAGDSLAERFVRHVRRVVADPVLGLSSEQPISGSCAAALFVSANHLAAVTRRELGCTPTECIRDTIVVEAKKMIAFESSTPLGEMASRLGFSSLAYFSRVLKAVEGRR